MALATQPSEEVTVTITGHDSTDVELSTATLTFTTVNWNIAQTVTVKAGQDDDGTNDEVTLTHTATGGDYQDLSDTLAVTVVDNDRGIVFTPTSLEVAEEDATGSTYTVALATQPSEEVTVTITGQAGTDLMLTGLSTADTLTFTTVNWNIAQTVTVKAGQDDDGTNDEVTLTHTAAGGNYQDLSDTLAVTVKDNDRRIVIAPSSLTVTRGDTTGQSYTVRLSNRPSGNVTVTIPGLARTDLALGGLSSANTLTFTTDNWDVAQTVTVTAAHGTYCSDEPEPTLNHTLAHVAAGGGYERAFSGLEVTVIPFIPPNTGDTTPPTFVSATTSEDGIRVLVTFSEDIAACSLALTIAEQTHLPIGDILTDLFTVTVDGDEYFSHIGSFSGPVLTLQLLKTAVRPGQEVRVAYNNILAQEPGGALRDLSGNIAPRFDFQPVTNVSRNTFPVRSIAPPVLSKSELTLCEGETGTYSVHLASQPTGNVAVASLVAPWTTSISDVSHSRLTFNDRNWNIPRTIRVATVADDDDHTDWSWIGYTITTGYEYLSRLNVIRILLLESDHPYCTNISATGQPAITGTAQVGQTLTADTSGISDADGLTNPTFLYQWLRSDGTTDTEIAGATSTTYLVTTDDVGKTIKVRVSFDDDLGNPESLTSAATAAVTAAVPGAPRSLAVQRGGTGELDVTWEAPASNGGSDITGYKV
ncbi:MAG: hypothetical protein F4X38_04475, partial [Acidimicrobiaceae bacterium]|nr:hypothetical protein [Acidimicrobiaceae bacterium]